jgi:hypothetical protein
MPKVAIFNSPLLAFHTSMLSTDIGIDNLLPPSTGL